MRSRSVVRSPRPDAAVQHASGRGEPHDVRFPSGRPRNRGPFRADGPLSPGGFNVGRLSPHSVSPRRSRLSARTASAGMIFSTLTISRASTSSSLRAPVRESTIQNRSMDGIVSVTRPRWNSRPLCQASISSPADNSEHVRTFDFPPASTMSPSPGAECAATSASTTAGHQLRSASSSKIAATFPEGDFPVSLAQGPDQGSTRTPSTRRGMPSGLASRRAGCRTDSGASW